MTEEDDEKPDLFVIGQVCMILHYVDPVECPGRAKAINDFDEKCYPSKVMLGE